MITFIPPNLKGELAKALEIWEEKLSDQELPDGLSSPSQWDSDSEEDEEISADTTVSLGLRYWDEVVELTCAEFIDLMQEFRNSKLLNSVACISKNRAIWRITPLNAMAYRAIGTQEFSSETPEEATLRDKYFRAKERVQVIHEEISDSENYNQLFPRLQEAEAEERRLSDLVGDLSKATFRTEVQVNGQTVEAGLITGFNVFSLHVVAAGLDHEYFPPVGSEEAFIEVNFPEKLTEDQIAQFVQAYLFELSATVGCEFVVSPRQEIEDAEADEYEGGLVRTPHRLRPLVTGKGIADLLTIYNRGVGTVDDELKILCFTKVIEFVAQTAIKRQSTETIHGKLMSSRAISPDAQFISELELLIEQQRVFKKDREAIRLTISLCCQATELSPTSPKFIKELSLPDLASDVKLQTAALNKFSDVLYSTRNSIAHAKSNYVPTGDECPSEALHQLATCSRRAAEQAIRWFASIPDPQRVI